MSLRTHLGRAATPLAVVGLISGCGAAVAATPTPVAPDKPVTRKHAPAATPKPAARTRAAAPTTAMTAIARRQYSTEIHGGAAFAALHRVGRDPVLLRTLQSGNLSATRAYVQRQFQAAWYHLHVSRMRILQGSRVVVETGVPFVVAPVQMTLHGPGGRTLGTLQVSIQDEIGFVRLMHRHHPVDVVVRGQRPGHVRGSLPAATQVKLPSTGSVTIAGQRYRVTSFHQKAWDNEPVTVSILQKG
jgi:hypothetical protein